MGIRVYVFGQESELVDVKLSESLPQFKRRPPPLVGQFTEGAFVVSSYFVSVVFVLYHMPCVSSFDPTLAEATCALPSLPVVST